MSNNEQAAGSAESQPRSEAWKTALTVLQSAKPPFVPEGAEAMTVLVEFPPGDPGTPPHRHSGPAFGYMLEGEMLFELEGEPERVIKAGETFLGAGRRCHPLPGRKQPDGLPEPLSRHHVVRTGSAHAHSGRRRRAGPAPAPTSSPPRNLTRHGQPGLTAMSCGRRSSAPE